MNPGSGTADVQRASEIRQLAAEAGLEVVDLVKEFDVFSEIRSRFERGEKLFVAAGGDGTINTVMQPIVGTEAELGILPIGTWNHFARDLGVPLDWREAMEIVVRGETHQIDVGRVNDRFFMNNISLGLYPEVVRHRERLRRFGKWRAYLKATSAAMKKFSHISVAIETPHHLEMVRTQVFMVSVNPYDLERPGVLAPRKTLDGGHLAVYWLPDMPKPQFIRAMARYLRGKMHEEGGVRSLQTTRLKVQTSESPIRVGMDGELTRLTPPLVISIVRRGINVRAPRRSV